MEVKAEHKYARISPRKVQIVCDLIRNKDAETAKAILQATPKAGAALLYKVLCSACANAENNNEMDPPACMYPRYGSPRVPRSSAGRASAGAGIPGS